MLKISLHERAELFDCLPVAGWAHEAYPSPTDELQTHFSGSVKGLVESYGEVATGGSGFFGTLAQVFLPIFDDCGVFDVFFVFELGFRKAAGG